ncbi:hypothetical protein L3X38_010887 [Prunus dulcis]|uniref:Uncharacterized protein n=1 Tax=Prunus dulcis TaxID=3755 RepID=A0AAD4ZEV4_PRUDU|nr:hypothetical protein L3X38_010887 [Prunus dulcis]
MVVGSWSLPAMELSKALSHTYVNFASKDLDNNKSAFTSSYGVSSCDTIFMRLREFVGLLLGMGSHNQRFKWLPML